MEGIPRLPSLEEIDSAYEEGKAAVVALIMEIAAEWVDEFQKQQEVLQQQQETITKLEERAGAGRSTGAEQSEQQQAALM